ncbi:hypothetical protein CDL15_Pgr006229 [Punica granatum]|uniref:Uncharacterized protein n=1 Tax=Punica granatum TaxID=22663 RepID=A0A218X3U6_PUNGR|nr:hypothetical protein CDL15_Pgr006229 [Punica granatum]
MDYGEEFWESSGNSAQDDLPFLSLSSTETPQINHFTGRMEHGSPSRRPQSHTEAIHPNPNLAQGSVSSSIINPPIYPPSTVEPIMSSQSMFQPADGQMMGMGTTMGGSVRMDQFQQGSLLYNSQNNPQQLRALAQPGPMSYAYPEAGSSALPRPTAPSMPLHVTGPRGFNQTPEAPMNTINFLDRDMPTLEHRPTERNKMPFMNSFGSANQGVTPNASFLSPEIYDDRNQFSNSSIMQLEEGVRAYGRLEVGDAHTWLDLGQAETTSQRQASLEAASSSRASWSTQNRRPIMNAVYDPIYEQMGLPIDPHLRLFLAKQARG